MKGTRPFIASRYTSYDSYTDADDNDIANQVQEAYNGYGQVTAEYQENAGAVDTDTSPVVQYAYSTDDNNSRLIDMVYPGGRQIDYSYDNSSFDNAISRVDGIKDDGADFDLVDYEYLGLNTIVDANNPQPNIDMTYIGDGPGVGGDNYTGLDQFGRVVEQKYVGTSADTVDLSYGYDADSNVMYEENELDSSDSQLFHASGNPSDGSGYDALNRLTDFERGELSTSEGGTQPDTIGSPTASDSWSLDALGNWDSEAVNGGDPTDRTVNRCNQVTADGDTDLTYDSNGNVLDDGSHTYTYDAWNRLATIADGARTFTDSYDALGRRIVEDYSLPAIELSLVASYTNLYYSTSWQVVEEDQQTEFSGYTNTTTNVWGQQYVNDLVEKDVTATFEEDSTTTRYYAEHDANFDTVALVSTGGSVLERYDYDPYGTVTFENSDFSVADGDASGYAMQVLFQGGRYDQVSGLTNFQHRDLNLALGTWQEQDPVGYAPGDNLYSVLDADPEALADAAGLCAGPAPCTCPPPSVSPSADFGYVPPQSGKYSHGPGIGWTFEVKTPAGSCQYEISMSVKGREIWDGKSTEVVQWPYSPEVIPSGTTATVPAAIPWPLDSEQKTESGNGGFVGQFKMTLTCTDSNGNPHTFGPWTINGHGYMSVGKDGQVPTSSDPLGSWTVFTPPATQPTTQQ